MKIVFYVGTSWKKWDGSSIKISGEGGSEQATWNMTKLFAARGHSVQIYNEPVNEGFHDGVEYLHHSKYHHLNADILISSRCPGAVDDAYCNQFNKKILMHHDCHEYASTTKERSDKFDFHYALSNWHANFLKSYYPFIKNIKLTANAINPELYQKQIIRRPHSIIYSSSPNRGLQNTIQVFEQVRKQIPDATLDVYYGFDNWEQTLKKHPNETEYLEMRLIKGMAEATAGVKLHGRVNPTELAQAQLSSSAWLYCTSWSETFCITALEARCSGLRTISSSLASLPEIARGTLINGNPETILYQKQAVEATIAALTNDNNSDRLIMMEEAQQCTWQSVCQQWLKDLEII